ncbi:MAG: saccharopine dehydrogenase NADP-binding domain-containing protein [Deltaproteobacteria bacterium]|nr:saccharopine dehydrogenase NADP-binding domain-containing protein [Deltaproteobacteria bacterium]
MSKIVVLGGCGGIGSVAVRALASGDYFDELVIADVRAELAQKAAATIAKSGVRGVAVDALDARSVHATIAGADVVLNCIGPFYKFGPPVLQSAIDARVAYVDVCDDLAPTRRMLEMDAAAQAAGVSALIGMGNSPGLANVFARLCADQLLEQVDSVDIMHIHGGEPEEGPAVIKHRIHAMVNDVPLFIDGRFISVRQLDPSGAAYVLQTEFRDIGTFPVYPYPHPETITLPQHIKGLQRATNLGVVFPLSYFHLTQDMVRVGACSDAPIRVLGQEVVPLEFSVAHILARRPQLLLAAGVSGPAGCLKVVVGGKKAGEAQTLVLSLSSKTAGAGEGTGIPAAVGAILMHRGRIPRRGVFPPEAGVQPFEVLTLASEISKKLGIAGGGSVHVEHIDASGRRTPIPLGM